MDDICSDNGSHICGSRFTDKEVPLRVHPHPDPGPFQLAGFAHN